MNIDTKILNKILSKLNSLTIERVIVSKKCKFGLTLEINKYIINTLTD